MAVGRASTKGSKANRRIEKRAVPAPHSTKMSLRLPVRSESMAPGSSMRVAKRPAREVINPIWLLVAPRASMYRDKKGPAIPSRPAPRIPSRKNQRRFLCVLAEISFAQRPPAIARRVFSTTQNQIPLSIRAACGLMGGSAAH